MVFIFIFRTFKSGEITEADITVYSGDCPEIDFLEHVVANISFSYPIRGQLKLTLISPFGTTSEILSYRRNDMSSEGAQFFPYMTVFNWGESPVGKWRLIVEAHENEKELSGSIDSFSLNFFGFKKPKASSSKRSNEMNVKAYIPSDNHLEKIYEEEVKNAEDTRIVHKRVFDSQPELREAIKRANNQN
jgi:subtilisin-like proprotein convertase family protein